MRKYELTPDRELKTDQTNYSTVASNEFGGVTYRMDEELLTGPWVTQRKRH